MKPVARASILALALSGAAHALPADQIFERAAPNLWALRTFDASNQPLNRGSAVAIAAGKAVTSCSLLARARRVELHRDKTVHAATLEFPDAARDLCQLDVPGLLAQEPPRAAPRMGQRVFAIGYERGAEMSITEGLFSRVRDAGSDAERIQTSVPTTGGLLGAGLFDEESRLLGLVTLSPRDASGVVSALPARWLVELADRGRAALAGRTVVAAQKVESFNYWEPGDKATYNWVLNNKAQQIEERWISATDREVVGIQKVADREIPLVVTKSPYRVQKQMGIISGQVTTSSPGENLLDLPLETGKQWTNLYTVTGETFTTQVSEVHTVESIEKVTVPAGAFDAFRIHRSALVTGRSNNGGAISIKAGTTTWLAFVAGKPVWVKIVYTNSRGDRATRELVSTSFKSVPQSVTGPSSPVAPAKPEAQTALADPTRASDTRPADALPMAGASWQYAYTMRGLGSARYTFGVRVLGVEGGVVHEIITIPSSPERLVSVSADSLSLRSFQLPQSQTLVELAPYLHSVLAKNEPRIWGNLAGYPVGNPILRPWTITVREDGQQDVTVPAGTFRATMIEVSGRRPRVSMVDPLARESGRFQIRVWYAPQVRRYVRLQHETWSASGDPFGVQLVELTSYTAK